MLHLLRVGLVVLALLIAVQPAGASNRTEQESKDGVAQAQEAARDQAAGLAVEKVVDTARAAATTMELPANRQAAAGTAAARQVMERFASPAVQKRLQGERAKVAETLKATQAGDPKQQTSQLATSEHLYLFLSSSMGEDALRRLLAGTARLGDEQVVPVFAGLPHGLDDWPSNTRFFQRVLQKEPTCRDTDANSCERVQVPLRINPVLFRQYGVTEVPTLVYDNGSRAWSVQGEAQLAVLLERIHKAADSPALAGLIASLRGGQ
ncbi:Type-F conjugative transfer system pilin assembly protein TrbC [Desulfobulbus propionicus DSM 2032]|uniref:Type-F conjugative transfer system pilin assembly protein TrbC n=1 Tax=Desulfobulbus propionicus (strain ATCC 33891 / DSM 2032 / VKM B-1956 / 1pr3) TaxID=577650 RepID=A0A7U4DMU9_DESPD|nr:TrbC family F-type conjugative pilus assembly protein [Desulfobulbus propionicus]ADW16346.1 Type-F conjugative transfer system pilin assembly protein TrbC [Desulfobulbus propionicus DSM 2032]